MHWQSIIAAAIVAVTLLIFVIRMTRPRPKGGCGHDCGCDHLSKKDPQRPL